MELARLNVGMYKAVRAVDKDFTDHGELPYFGFRTLWEYSSWLLLLRSHKRGEDLPPGWSPYEILVMLDEQGAICAIGQMRTADCRDNLTWLGHIGYSVPPGKRRRGYATVFLGMLLNYAWDACGMSRCLVTCDVDNVASRKVIEHCGGAYAGQYHDSQYHKLQYWFYPPGTPGGEKIT